MGHELRLNYGKARADLNRFCSELYGHGCEWSLSSAIPSGFGRIVSMPDRQIVEIGVSDLCEKSCLRGLSPVSDLDFVSAKVTAAHEYRHYLQDIGEASSPEIDASRMSVVGNPVYYENFWNELPHEIDAEWAGVDATWDDESRQRPETADAAMLAYVNYRTGNTKYPLPPVEGGY